MNASFEKKIMFRRLCWRSRPRASRIQRVNHSVISTASFSEPATRGHTVKTPQNWPPMILCWCFINDRFLTILHNLSVSIHVLFYGSPPDLFKNKNKNTPRYLLHASMRSVLEFQHKVRDSRPLVPETTLTYHLFCLRSLKVERYLSAIYVCERERLIKMLWLAHV